MIPPIKTIAIRGYYPNSLLFLLLLICFASCNNEPTAITKSTPSGDTLTEIQKHLPENALKGLIVAEGLEVKPMATEPMLKNPTNIDVDEKGRVWVTEAYNYRPAINGNPTNPKGDRIMILQDNNGDGRIDTAKVFYQGPEINAPLGICVLGRKVLVSQSPYAWIFYDDNGDDIADRKEILFQGIGGEQHDHGMHAFTFGPDGKLYFNFGNEGKTLRDKNGNTVKDQDGDEIGPKKYKQGMVFRCDTNGSHVECLGQNFRNPYEVAVDSYGTLWQSDNDDDGNRGVRINYVMPYGNYGYTDEMTGAGWSENRTNREDSIPYRHWHLNDPGSVPNLLQTGAGSPTGMLIYEGSLLPAVYRNQIIHSDAGPNVVRSYTVKNDGAGYSAEIVNILKAGKDQWFRPADVATAPDGSVIVADWYDVGVGGHQAGDQVRGRIYRIAPPGISYTIKEQDYHSAAGAVTALQNPNLAVRYLAFTALQTMGSKAIPALEKLWKDGENPRMRARAFWVLLKIAGPARANYIREASNSAMADFRIMAIRAAIELNDSLININGRLVNDADPQVRRECAIALHHNRSSEAAKLWTRLALGYDGKDRWYLEALGIGADRQWDVFFPTWLEQVKDPLQNQASRDIVWRARNEAAVPWLARLASEQTIPLKERLRYFRAFDFHAGTSKYPLLLAMIEKNDGKDIEFDKLILHLIDKAAVKKSAAAQKALGNVLLSVEGTPEYLELVSRYQLHDQNEKLLQLALVKSGQGIGEDAASLLINQNGSSLIWAIISGSDTARSDRLLASVGGVGSKTSIDMLQTIALSKKYPLPLRKYATAQIGRTGGGEKKILELLRGKKIPDDQLADAVFGVRFAWETAVRTEAASYLPKTASLSARRLPVFSELLSVTGNADAGKIIFTSKCSICHQVNKDGADFGPALTEIASKYPPEGLFNAIVSPSAGISFGYEGWELQLKDGSTLTGIISSKTGQEIELKSPGGSKKKIPTADILSRKQLKQSLMTEGLFESMSSQDLSNLLSYLGTLRKK